MSYVTGPTGYEHRLRIRRACDQLRSVPSRVSPGPRPRSPAGSRHVPVRRTAPPVLVGFRAGGASRGQSASCRSVAICCGAWRSRRNFSPRVSERCVARKAYHDRYELPEGPLWVKSGRSEKSTPCPLAPEAVIRPATSQSVDRISGPRYG
jgi:hypothetical protein